MKKSGVSFFDLLVRFLALILAIALLLGCLAGRIDPRTSKYIPFFGLAYPYILVLNGFMVIWWLVRRRWTLMLGTLVFIGLGWPIIAGTFQLSGEEGVGAKRSADQIRMMTYNVHNFSPFDPDGDAQVVKTKILHIIKQENPDIIGLQEYFTRYKGALDMTDSLKEILNTPYYYFVPSMRSDDQATGLAIFSKYPIKSSGSITFDPNHGGNAGIFVDVLIRQKMMRIYNVHLQSISFNPEDYAYMDKIKNKMDPQLQPSKRILSRLKIAFIKRSAQVDILKAHMRNCKTPYLIAGDFNDTPASYAVTQLTKNLNRSFEAEGSGMGRTYNGKFPNFQIDYIAATKDLRILNHRVIRSKLSDHFAVRSDLQFKL